MRKYSALRCPSAAVPYIRSVVLRKNHAPLAESEKHAAPGDVRSMEKGEKKKGRWWVSGPAHIQNILLFDTDTICQNPSDPPGKALGVKVNRALPKTRESLGQPLRHSKLRRRVGNAYPAHLHGKDCHVL